MLWRKAIILLREFRVAWLAGSLANAASYILNSNPLCSSKRSLVAASRCTSIGIFLLYACPGGILCTLPDSADQQFLDLHHNGPCGEWAVRTCPSRPIRS